MTTGYADDLRQIFVVTKNEMIKYTRGRKAMILLAIIFLMWGLITALVYAYGGGIQSVNDFGGYVSFAWILIIIVVAMFSSGTIVSEFEDRTALVLFTRPIKKSSIFVGKAVAAFVLGVLAMMVFFVLSFVTVVAATGKIPSHMGLSLLLLIIAVFAATGVAMFVSSIVKRGNTAAVITFFLLALITNIITNSATLFDIDPWYMIDYVANDAIRALQNGFVNIPGQTVEVEGMPGLTAFRPSYYPFRSMGVGLAWGTVGTVASFLFFRRKEL